MKLYQITQDQMNSVPNHDILIVMRDINIKVGTKNEGFESFMGQQGVREWNKNEYFLDLQLIGDEKSHCKTQDEQL